MGYYVELNLLHVGSGRGMFAHIIKDGQLGNWSIVGRDIQQSTCSPPARGHQFVSG